MNDITLDDVTQEAFDTESRILVDMLRTKYPKLDLRAGTALRDLLINPDATIGAWFEAEREEQRECSSLSMLEARAAEGKSIDVADVNAILSNFGMTSSEGTKATGSVRVNVAYNRSYTLANGFVFTTADGISFAANREYTVSESLGTLYTSTAGYYFVVGVTAVEVGSKGNLKKGDSLNPDTSFYGFVTAEAYDDFSNGSDVEDLSNVIARIPAAVSQRGLVTQPASESQLRHRYEGTNNPVLAVSAVGYGNPAQFRDRHNALGVGVGGRVDLYVRNFTELPVYSFTPEFTYEDGKLEYTLTADELPGMAFVLGVYGPTGGLGGYLFETTYIANTAGTWHDIDVSNSTIEVANTVWRDVKISVDTTENGLPDQNTNLQIQAVALPLAKEIQNYVDSTSVRNVGSDFIVRCPMLCQVAINATVRHPSTVEFNVDYAKTALCNFINSTGFIKRLTRSQIACILQACGATSVFMTPEMLTGQVVDGNGRLHILSGDSLDLIANADPKALLTEDTTVFVCSPESISITEVDD